MTARVLGLLVSMMLCAAGASAFSWFEIGDAGMLLDDAQPLGGGGPIDYITGSIQHSSDADLYRIHIFDPDAFFASTVNDDTSVGDTRLYLFDHDGMGISFSEDVSEFDYRSRLTNQFVPDEGDYYLAVSSYDFGPQSGTFDSFFNIWFDVPWTVERAPDGPGAGAPLSHWAGYGYGEGGYRIDLGGVEAITDIPEPTSLVLVALGAALLGRRKRAPSVRGRGGSGI